MANLSVTVVDGNNLTVTVAPVASQTITIDRGVAGPQGPAGTATPGGSNGQIQFNNSGSIGGALSTYSPATGDLAWNNNITALGLGVSTTGTSTAAAGRFRWDAASATASFGQSGNGGSVIEGDVGQTIDAQVTNAESVAITKGQIVYAYQSTGNRMSVKLASNSAESTSSKTIGIAAEDIPANQIGIIRCVGVLAGLNLSAFSAGQTLYLGTTAGSLTATKPSAPNHLVYVGIVERANAGNGQLYIRCQNGYELDEIHDVQIVSPTTGQSIFWDSTVSLWKNGFGSPRYSTDTTSTTLTWTSDAVNSMIQRTAQSGNVTIAADSNTTPNNGAKVMFRIKNDSTTTTLTVTPTYTGARSFRLMGVSVPAVLASGTLYIGAVYNSADDKWDILATGQGTT